MLNFFLHVYIHKCATVFPQHYQFLLQIASFLWQKCYIAANDWLEKSPWTRRTRNSYPCFKSSSFNYLSNHLWMSKVFTYKLVFQKRWFKNDVNKYFSRLEIFKISNLLGRNRQNRMKLNWKVPDYLRKVLEEYPISQLFKNLNYDFFSGLWFSLTLFFYHYRRATTFSIMVTDFSISSPLFKFLPFPKLESMDSGLKYKKNVQIGGASMAEINTFNIFS